MITKVKTNRAIKTVASLVAVSALGFGLSACSHPPKPNYKPIVIPTTQQIRAKLKHQLIKARVSFVQVGQTIRLILPSDYFFHPGSANLYKSQVKVLTKIKRYISSYLQSEVTVKGYTADGFGSDYLNALSAKRAEMISHRLWGMGLDTRLTIASGLGATNSVDSNDTVKGRFNNNRVEITFMYRENTPLYD